MNAQTVTQYIEVTPHYYYKKALAFMHEGKLNDTMQHIDSAVLFSSHAPFYIYQKIKLMIQLNDFDTCSEYILKQLNYLYKNASLYIVCKVLHYYQMLNELSHEEFKELLILKEVPYCLAEEYKNVLDGTESNLFYLAKKAHGQDNHILCVDYCTIMMKKKKATFEAYYLAAYSSHMIGNLHKACEYYKKCVKLNPEYDIAYSDLGLALMELREYNEALNYLNKARYLHPGNVDYLSHIGECYYALKQYDLAQETFENIISIYPSRLQTYFNLSYICKKQDKKRLSRKYIKIIQKRIKK